MPVDLQNFLAALKIVALSPYALIGYALVVAAWAAIGWQTRRLHIIADRLSSLPEKDRLKALELEYRLQPKGGLDATSYLQLRTLQLRYVAVLRNHKIIT